MDIELLESLIKSCPGSEDYLYFDKNDKEWIVTNEWLCGTFAGRSFSGETKQCAMEKLINYFDAHKFHASIVGSFVTESGWPDINMVKMYLSDDS